MPYAIADRELTQPLAELRLSPEQSGVALLVRRERRPVAFIMTELPAGATLSPEELDALISSWAAYEIVSDSVRAELVQRAANGHPRAEAPRKITVAICTRARTDLLKPCVSSVLALPQWGSDAIEVLVIDNAPPDDGTKRLVESLGGVRYTVEPRAGLDFARNRALEQAQGEFVAFLDDDVEVDREWLSGLQVALAENPDAAIVTGLVLPYELETEAQILFEQRGGFRRGFTKRRYRGPHLPGNYLYPAGSGMFGAGANMVVRRDVARALGGFDEALDTGPPLPGGGDLDIFFRVVEAGKPLVYEPSMLVFHKHRREHRQLRRQYWTWGTGLMAYLTKTSKVDPRQRPKLRDLRRWWVLNELRLLKQSVKDPRDNPSDLALAEFAGGAVGVAGTYRRSRRRSEKIKAAHR